MSSLSGSSNFPPGFRPGARRPSATELAQYPGKPASPPKTALPATPRVRLPTTGATQVYVAPDALQRAVSASDRQRRDPLEGSVLSASSYAASGISSAALAAMQAGAAVANRPSPPPPRSATSSLATAPAAKAQAAEELWRTTTGSRGGSSTVAGSTMGSATHGQQQQHADADEPWNQPVQWNYPDGHQSVARATAPLRVDTARAEPMPPTRTYAGPNSAPSPYDAQQQQQQQQQQQLYQQSYPTKQQLAQLHLQPQESKYWPSSPQSPYPSTPQSPYPPSAAGGDAYYQAPPPPGRGGPVVHNLDETGRVETYDLSYDIYQSYTRPHEEKMRPLGSQNIDPATLAQLTTSGNTDSNPRTGYVVDEDFDRMVQEIVPVTDHPETPSLTIRVWILGTFFCVILAFANQVFSFRTNYFSVTNYVAILLAFPLGKAMAKWMPRYQWRAFGFVMIDTNPGPFTVKEHVLIGIFGSTGAAGVYGTENLITQKVFYGTEIGHLSSILFLLSTSLIGFGVAGTMRRLVIRPRQMLWPSVLPLVSLYSAFFSLSVKALQSSNNASDAASSTGYPSTGRPTKPKKHMSRILVFAIGALGMGVWQLVGPGFLAPMLGYLPLLCWFAPKSNNLLQLWGSPNGGAGILSLTLDWTVVSSNLPMSIPLWSTVNIFVGNLLTMWILAPISDTQGWWGITNLPINTASLQTAKKKVNASELVTNNQLDLAKYKEKGQLFLSPTFAWSYMGSMATFTSAISHTIVWYGKDTVRRIRDWRNDRDSDNDIHCQLIDVYPEVPMLVYVGIFVGMAVVVAVVCQVSAIAMPLWATVLSLAVAVLGTPAIAVVMATTGSMLYLNVVSEFIIGLILPGSPVVMMSFKTLAVTVSQQALILLGDLKLGHYLKIPPRHIWWAQVVSQVLAVFSSYASMLWWLGNPEHEEWMRKHSHEDKLTGIGADWNGNSHAIYYTASLVWGAIGPMRFFFESTYAPLIYGGFALGAVVPVFFKLCHKFVGGIVPWNLIQGPLLFSLSSPGGNQSFTFTSMVVALVFQGWLYRSQPGWWKRYNYVLASSFDVGSAIVSLLIIGVFGSYNVTAPTWFLNPNSEPDPDAYTATYGPSGDWCLYTPQERKLVS
ncbi:hypothetical protein GGF31_000596 [Allomyces arbusculus]|nr:hypothetical protein GGF31_000596 [Allomyces arbusculus]